VLLQHSTFRTSPGVPVQGSRFKVRRFPIPHSVGALVILAAVGRHFQPQALPALMGVVVGPELGLGSDLDQGVVRGACVA